MIQPPGDRLAAPINFDNCDVEPIHIPGQIQSNGALLAFDLSGRPVGWSANTAQLAGLAPRIATHVDELMLESPRRSAHSLSA
jgi:light-regulated signal transduction histidine kinase (bacteriophytochrome)